MGKDRLYVRIRESDKLIKDHFNKIDVSDHSYEVRRLLNKSIENERKEKKLEEAMNMHGWQGS